MSSTISFSSPENATISVELLDTLLTPPNPTARLEAEQFYQNLSPLDKLRGLLHLLLSLGDAVPNTPEGGRRMLSCTLLRREISNLGSGASSTDNGSVVEDGVVSSLLFPLLDIYFKTGESVASTASNMIGHCVAEVCLVLSIRCNTVYNDATSDNLSSQCMKEVLSKISQYASGSPSNVVFLLGCVAIRAPVSFYNCIANSDQLLQFLPNVMNQMISNSTSDVSKSLSTSNVCVECVCHLSTAISTVENSATQGEVSEMDLSLESVIEDLFHSPTSVGTVASARVQWMSEQLLLPLLGHLDGAIKSGLGSGETIIQSILQQFMDSIPRSPVLYATSGIQQGITGIVLTIIRSDASEVGLKVTSLETLSTLCQYTNITADGPVMTELLNPTTGILMTLSKLLIESVDDDVNAWAIESSCLLIAEGASKQEDDSYDGDSEYLNVMESLLEGFVSLLKRENTLPILFNFVQSLLQVQDNSDWKRVRGGLSILQICHDSAPHLFQPYLGDALKAGVQFGQSDNLRVQYQAIQLLGCIIGNDEENTEEVESAICQNVNEVLNVLITGLTSNCQKVVSHTCLSLISYCRGGRDNREEVLGDRAPAILTALQSGPMAPLSNPQLRTGGVVVNAVRGIHVMACIADCMAEGYVPYYNDTKMLLTAAMQVNSQEESVAVLRGSALEAFTVILSSTSSQEESALKNDAAQVMTDFILPLLQTPNENIVSSEILLTSSARLASVLKSDYVPFLPTILSPLISIIQAKPQISVQQSSSLDASSSLTHDDDGTETFTLSLPGVTTGPQTFSLNTTQIQQKANACRAIYEIANQMKDAFTQVDACINAILPLVSFAYSPEVRSTASQSLAPLFKCACMQNHLEAPKMLHTLLESICKQLVLEDVTDLEPCLALSDSMSEVADVGFTHNISYLPINAEPIVAILLPIVEACITRRGVCLSHMSIVSDPEDVAMYQVGLSQEGELLTSCVDTIGFILKLTKDGFIPIFEKIAPLFQPLLTNNVDKRVQCCAVALYDDMVEYTGAAGKYAPILLSAAMEGLATQIPDDDDDDVYDFKAVSVYGIIQIVRYAPDVIQPIAGNVLGALNEICSGIDKSGENDGLVENAISGVSMMVLFRDAGFKGLLGENEKMGVLNVLMQSLPLRNVDSVSKICMDGLYQLIESGEVDISAHASTLMKIFAETFQLVADGDEVATPETCAQFKQVLAKMQQQVDSSVMETAFAGLDGDEQVCIQMAMQG